jgi:NADH:ubiquinone oxidoreductase subunit F (NADH-binding)
MQIDTKTDFKSFEAAIKQKPEKIIQLIKKSGLTGRGGANFPTGLKWEFTAKEKNKNKVLICNADEGEPGTFKDRYIIYHNPDLLIEGIAIAAYAIGAKRAYIYLRIEYEYLREKLEQDIKKRKKYLDKIGLKLDIFEGAGAYVCGDETAILNSIEGKRGEPRNKPPFPAQFGVWGLPTCIDNVATLANVPLILVKSKKWQELNLFSLSGNLQRPGVYEFKKGIKSKTLIQKGEPEEKIKALFFGAAGGCVPYSDNLILDDEAIKKKGAMLGSCTVIAVSKSQSIPHLCKNIQQFFVHESCGKCVPCREGNFRQLQLLERICAGDATNQDLILLEELATMINQTSFCGLGKASNTHILTSLKYFKKEFEDLCK